MPELDVIIHRVGDPSVVHEPDVRESTIEKAVVIEAGMASGKPAVGFLIRLPDGGLTFVQTSAALLDMVCAAARGVS